MQYCNIAIIKKGIDLQLYENKNIYNIKIYFKFIYFSKVFKLYLKIIQLLKVNSRNKFYFLIKNWILLTN